MPGHEIRENLIRKLAPDSPPNPDNNNNNDQEDIDAANEQDAKTTAEDAEILKRYKILQLIGSGNYSRVYKCLTSSGKEIAIKTINLAKNSQNYTKKFLPRELSVLKRINHVNICKTHEIIQIADRICILMPYCEKGTIADLMMKGGPLCENVSRFLFAQVLEAIIYLHLNDIAHRDVKVENILLTNDFVAKLTDFSYSTFTTGNSPQATKTVGCTPNGNPPPKQVKSPNSNNTNNNNNNNGNNNNNTTKTTNANATATTTSTSTSTSSKKVSSPNAKNNDQNGTIKINLPAQDASMSTTYKSAIFKSGILKSSSPKSIKGNTIYHRQSALIKTIMHCDIAPKLNGTFCGTLPYLAPEVIRMSAYDAKKVDVWSLGVCLFVMINDKLPFGFNDLKKMIKKQTSRDYKFRLGFEATEQLKDIMNLMFEPDFTRRVEARELVRHAWILGPMEKPSGH